MDEWVLAWEKWGGGSLSESVFFVFPQWSTLETCIINYAGYLQVICRLICRKIQQTNSHQCIHLSQIHNRKFPICWWSWDRGVRPPPPGFPCISAHRNIGGVSSLFPVSSHYPASELDMWAGRWLMPWCLACSPRWRTSSGKALSPSTSLRKRWPQGSRLSYGCALPQAFLPSHIEPVLQKVCHFDSWPLCFCSLKWLCPVTSNMQKQMCRVHIWQSQFGQKIICPNNFNLPQFMMMFDNFFFYW